MKKAKVICMCGSLKYTDLLMQETERLTLEGYNVISVIYETKTRDAYSEADIRLFEELHFQKIELADAIFVVNKEGHIGEGTMRDIEYAKQLGKEILYMEKVPQKILE